MTSNGLGEEITTTMQQATDSNEINEFSTHNQTRIPAKYESGYDLPVYGLETGEFSTFHILALSCMGASLVCAVTIIVLSCKKHNVKGFFSWTRGEKTVIYVAICDGCFNIVHALDHGHYLISRDHVRPLWLCQIYGFMLIEFISSQTLLINIAAISAFMLVYYQKSINFGSRDWKLLVYIFGVPFVGGALAGILDQLGPNGAFCYFDAVKGYLSSILFTTAPMVLVVIINIILYLLTWYRIYKESTKIKATLGQNAVTSKSSTNAAKTMMLFVVAYVIQIWAAAVWGMWQVFDHSPPFLLYRFLTTFSNLGGVFNGIVYGIIRYRIGRDRQRRWKRRPENGFCSTISSGSTEFRNFSNMSL